MRPSRFALVGHSINLHRLNASMMACCSTAVCRPQKLAHPPNQAILKQPGLLALVAKPWNLFRNCSHLCSRLLPGVLFLYHRLLLATVAAKQVKARKMLADLSSDFSTALTDTQSSSLQQIQDLTQRLQEVCAYHPPASGAALVLQQRPAVGTVSLCPLASMVPC